MGVLIFFLVFIPIFLNAIREKKWDSRERKLASNGVNKERD